MLPKINLFLEIKKNLYQRINYFYNNLIKGLYKLLFFLLILRKKIM